MKKTIWIRYLIGSLLISCLYTTGFTQTNWKILEDYAIKFSGSGADGTFRGLKGVIEFDPENLADSRFEVSIDPMSIATGNKTKDKHARGKSWFDVESFTQIRFVSNEIRASENGYSTEGILTLHGVPKQAKIDFSFTNNSPETATFEGKMTVNRKDFGIEGPLVSFMVGEEFEVNLIVPVSK